MRGSGPSGNLNRQSASLAGFTATLAFLRSTRRFDFKSRRRKQPSWMIWMRWFSRAFSVLMFTVVFSPSLQSFPPAEAIRSAHLDQINHRADLGTPASGKFLFRRSPAFRNMDKCRFGTGSECDPLLVHVAITLDEDYLRGSMAAVNSILQHAACPESVFFHFLVEPSGSHLGSLVRATFPGLKFKVYPFDPVKVRSLISTSVRVALEQPLNYARNYLANLVEPCVNRVIYLDSDLILVDDIAALWATDLGSRTIGAPEYCHANFTKYFTPAFWSSSAYAGAFSGRRPCYFNTGVMVIDLARWRRSGYTRQIEKWMEFQKKDRIYELGSLPPFLLVFAGNVSAIEHRWNQHGLGGDNVGGSCRDLHRGKVSLLHWSGSGKPWLRLDSPCPLDAHWLRYDLYGFSHR